MSGPLKSSRYLEIFREEQRLSVYPSPRWIGGLLFRKLDGRWSGVTREVRGSLRTGQQNIKIKDVHGFSCGWKKSHLLELPVGLHPEVELLSRQRWSSSKQIAERGCLDNRRKNWLRVKVSEHREDRLLSSCAQSMSSVSSVPLAMFSETLFRSGTEQGLAKCQGVGRSDCVLH